MSDGKKPLITRERYKAYLQEKEREPKESSKKLTEETLKRATKRFRREPAANRRRDKEETAGTTRTEKQPASQPVKEQRAKEPAAKEPKAKESANKVKKSRQENRWSPEVHSRLSEKEKGRRLDKFYNWAIILVLLAIILVFVLAFVI